MGASGCWEDRGQCELWAGKLRAGKEAAVAVEELGKNGCWPHRGLLLEHLGDANLGPDVLAALVALGRGPEAEAAVARALARPETAEAAARQVVAWHLASAEGAVRAALADPTLTAHHGALLEAGLALAPAARWLDGVTRGLAAARGNDAAVDRALAALAQVDWAGVAPASVAPVAAALAELATRPPGAAPAGQVAAAARELARLPRLDSPPSLPEVAARARAGHRGALLVLWGFAPDEAHAIARSLAAAADLDPATRATALALVALAPPADLAAEIGAAPADAALLEGLALLAGEAAAPVLAARLEADKGVARAALARAQAFALGAEALPDWRSGLERQASQLMRAIPSDPVVAAVLALTQDCQRTPGCYARIVREALPALETLDADLGAATAAHDEAQRVAQAAVAADAERAKALAAASGEAVAAAKVELDAMQARRDEVFAGVRAARERLDRLAATRAVVAVALRRGLVGAAGEEAEAAGGLARAVLRKCRGEACAGLRAWALAAMVQAPRPGADEVAGLVAANSDDPALAWALAALAARPR